MSRLTCTLFVTPNGVLTNSVIILTLDRYGIEKQKTMQNIVFGVIVKNHNDDNFP